MNILRNIAVGTLLLGTSVFAFAIPVYDGFVTDKADILNPIQERALTQKIESIEKATTAEISILTVPSTEGMDISQYAVEVAQEWGVGKEDTDNGVMIVVAVDDRQWFIATGYGVEGILPDLRTKHIAERHFPDNFRAGDYATGLEAAIDDIGGFLAQDESIISEYAYQEAGAKITSLGGPAFFLLIILSGFFRSWVRKDKDKKTRRALTVAGGLALVAFVLVWMVLGIILFGIMAAVIAFFFSLLSCLSGGGMWVGGGRGGFGGGGGFGGFGGGGFGGGGSGGRW